MALRLLIDVSVGTAVERWLDGTMHDTATVRSTNPGMEDADILAWAVQEQRLVITMDKDFGELVYRSGQFHAGVLLLRLEDAPAAEKVRVLEAILTQHESKLAGRFSVYQNGRLRIR